MVTKLRPLRDLFRKEKNVRRSANRSIYLKKKKDFMLTAQANVKIQHTHCQISPVASYL